MFMMHHRPHGRIPSLLHWQLSDSNLGSVRGSLIIDPFHIWTPSPCSRIFFPYRSFLAISSAPFSIETSYVICMSHFLASSLLWWYLIEKFFGRCHLDLWPITLTLELDLDTDPSIWPTCQNSNLYVCPFNHESETDTSHTYDAKLLHLSLMPV